tara:strand:- start:1495 stop:2535 length:1041 start_codon:yes stop_codon:yes gene_type:complete
MKIKKFSIILISFLVIFEIVSFFFTHLELFIFNEKPKYSFEEKFLNDWIIYEENKVIWHKKNYKTRHAKRCFNVEYATNNVGARDYNDYFFEKNKESIMLVGDSFAEGVGVDIDNIFAKIIEKKLEKKVLNFGVAGTNPQNQFNKYIKSEKNYNYDELIYFFLPQNDYFKPIKQNKEKKKILKKNEKKVSKFNDINLGQIKYQIANILARFTYSYNFIRSAAYVIDSNFNYGYENLSYFYKDQKSIDYTFNYIKKIILHKNIKTYIVIIPTIYDINNYQKNKINYKNFYWFKELNRITKKNNIILIDLMDHIDFTIKPRYFHSCDGHWNDFGNKFAAETFLKYYNY